MCSSITLKCQHASESKHVKITASDFEQLSSWAESISPAGFKAVKHELCWLRGRPHVNIFSTHLIPLGWVKKSPLLCLSKRASQNSFATVSFVRYLMTCQRARSKCLRQARGQMKLRPCKQDQTSKLAKWGKYKLQKSTDHMTWIAEALWSRAKQFVTLLLPSKPGKANRQWLKALDIYIYSLH